MRILLLFLGLTGLIGLFWFKVDGVGLYRDIKITDVVTALATVILALITVWYAYSTHEILKITRQQTILTQDPVVRIVPETMVQGEPGKISLTVANRGIVDVVDVNIYEDYFATGGVKDKDFQIVHVGASSVLPNTVIDSLIGGSEKSFEINFIQLLDQMQSVHSEKKGFQTRIIRLKIEFSRSIDKKKYAFFKVYLIGGHGDFLFDGDARGIDRSFESQFGLVSWARLKRSLGVSE